MPSSDNPDSPLTSTAMRAFALLCHGKGRAQIYAQGGQPESSRAGTDSAAHPIWVRDSGRADRLEIAGMHTNWYGGTEQAGVAIARRSGAGSEGGGAKVGR